MMSESQRLGWRYAIAQAPKGLLRRLDRGLLAVWVVAEDTHREASILVAKYGLLLKSKRDGAEPVQSPYLAIQNRQALIMMKAASELGFTPTARSRITVDGAGAQASQNRFANNGRRPA